LNRSVGIQRQLQVRPQLGIARPIRQGTAITGDRAASLAGLHVRVALVVQQRARHDAAVENLLVQDGTAEIVFRTGGLVKGLQRALIRSDQIAWGRCRTAADGRPARRQG